MDFMDYNVNRTFTDIESTDWTGLPIGKRRAQDMRFYVGHLQYLCSFVVWVVEFLCCYVSHYWSLFSKAPYPDGISLSWFANSVFDIDLLDTVIDYVDIFFLVQAFLFTSDNALGRTSNLSALMWQFASSREISFFIKLLGGLLTVQVIFFSYSLWKVYVSKVQESENKVVGSKLEQS